ncbi:OmpA family protein [Flavobacterium sp. NST-5]|uniref:OmpA family protein n=1 Tax=Flavobacterium ichthyis TaxID=2698827 RepID=A0ABW9ZCB5_9FLAO|nr:OmpA family protein [Flavobacterium ichthyis]NBL65741.1 OmpA family protein [Flavobacterium ichthyis]
MKFLHRIIPLLFFVSAFAQEEVVHSVYFETAKFDITQEQSQETLTFVQSVDSSRIESISIYGYCDDRGKDEYNFKLSNNRANTIKEQLLEAGIKSKIIVTIEGRGRVLIEDDIDNVSEVRSKNRRVDVVLNFKEIPVETLNVPGIRNKIVSNHVVGDRVYLEKILFEKGSSKLTLKSRKELDYIARQLQKYRNLHFEIQGHVCCTPKFHKDAIDKDTKKRKLSQNRAEAVYKYLIIKKIDKKRMSFKGYGNTQPLGQGADLDRRVELVITKV